MSRRPDPWLLEGALIVRADEAHALWPLLQRGIGEWSRMGATRRLEAVGDLLVRWRALAEEHDAQLAGSVNGTGDSSGGGDRRSSGHASWITTAEAADALRCSPRWVTALARRGELHARRVGRVWLVDPASVHAYRDRAAG